MTPPSRKILGAALVVLGLAACGGPHPQTTLDPTSDFGVRIDDLFNTIFWFAVAVFVVVEVLLLYTIIRYRAKPGQPPPRHVHGSTLLEISWTLAPVVILIFIAVPTMKTIFEVDGTAPEGALKVQVVGRQWWWEYRYTDLGITTANELHVPVARPVQLEMTSGDVIHAFWPPRLGGKRDVMAGRRSYIAFTADSVGTFRGQCGEFCGESHALMGLRVMVDDSATFAQWVTNQTTAPVVRADSLTGLAREGAEAFRRVREPASNSCIACHAIQGISMGILGPSLSHVGSRTTIAAGVLPNDSAGLVRWLRDPPAVKPGSKMPRIEMTDQEIAALVAFLSGLR
jgi:cytochrome c oxidase subunit 2